MKRVYKVVNSSKRDRTTDEVRTARSQWADRVSFRNLVQRLSLMDDRHERPSEKSLEDIPSTPVLHSTPTQMPVTDVPETFKGRIFYV